MRCSHHDQRFSHRPSCSCGTHKRRLHTIRHLFQRRHGLPRTAMGCRSVRFMWAGRQARIRKNTWVRPPLRGDHDFVLQASGCESAQILRQPAFNEYEEQTHTPTVPHPLKIEYMLENKVLHVERTKSTSRVRVWHHGWMCLIYPPPQTGTRGHTHVGTATDTEARTKSLPCTPNIGVGDADQTIYTHSPRNSGGKKDCGWTYLIPSPVP